MENKEKLDLVEILKDCPEGMTLYSPIYGEVYLCGINNAQFFPIVVENSQKNTVFFNKIGRYSNCIGAECMLFPSKDCRDWSKFKAPKPEYEFTPFEKVLVRDSEDQKWRVSLFDFKTEGDLPYFVIGSAYKYCIPYEGNEYLHGKTDKPNEL
jgi:hypothetical protein